MTDIKQPEPDDTTATVTEEQPSEAAVEPAAENADTGARPTSGDVERRILLDSRTSSRQIDGFLVSSPGD